MSELKKNGERRNGLLVAKEEMEEEEEKVTLKRPVFRIWVPNSRNVCSHARKLFHNMRIEQGKMPLYHDLLLIHEAECRSFKKGQLLAEHFYTLKVHKSF